MIRLRGEPQSPGSAYGLVALLRGNGEPPLLPAQLVDAIARASGGAIVDEVEVVVAARDAMTAERLLVPCARVVAIAAEDPGAPLDARIPVVTGVADLLSSSSPEVLALVDGDNGVVLIDPTPAAIASFQAERERILPRTRYFLDYPHQPAFTADGRPIHILARAEALEDVARAVESGADAIVVQAGSAALDSEAADEEQLAALQQIGESAAGKPITLIGDLQSVAIPALLRAAARAEFTLALPLSGGLDGFREAREYIGLAQQQFVADEEEFAQISLAAWAAPGTSLPDDLDGFTISRLIVPAPVALSGPESARWLDMLGALAARYMTPLEVALDHGSGSLEPLIGAGAAGIIVSPESVQPTKETIRQLDSASCREQWRLGLPS